MTAARLLTQWLQRQWLRVWLRAKLTWAESDVAYCAERLELAHLETEALPRQLLAYQDAAADLRIRLVSLGALPVQRNVPKPMPWPDAPPPRRGHL
jgi:hypothetical protein